MCGGRGLAVPVDQAGVDERLGFGVGALTVARVQAAHPFALAQELASLSMSEIEALGEDAAQAVIVAAERVVTAVQARSTVALVTLAHRVQSRLDADADDFRAHTGKGIAYQSAGDQIVPSMVAPALRIATRTAASRLSADHALVAMRGTLAAYWAGDLERHRADTVVDHALALPAELRDRYEARVLESSADPVTGEELPLSSAVRDMARSTLSRHAAKIARDLDPECTRNEAERARDERTVRAWAAEFPGSTRWEALLPSETSARMWSAIDALASQYARANPGMLMDAARADALADLVLASASVTTTVTLLIPALPLHESIAFAVASDEVTGVRPLVPVGPGSDRPLCQAPGANDAGAPLTWFLAGVANDPRVGALMPETVAAILADPKTLVRLARLDPDGSLATSPRTHDPGAALRRAVQTRDGTCRFPGCHTPAIRCDLDHVIEFPRGLTEPSNLAALCRTHHVFKHHGGWTTSMDADAVLHWTTPEGRVYTTHPRATQLVDDLGLSSSRPSPAPAEPKGAHAPGPTLIELASLVEPTSSSSDGFDGPDGSDDRLDPLLEAPSDWSALGEPLTGGGDGPPDDDESGCQVHVSSPIETRYTLVTSLDCEQPVRRRHTGSTPAHVDTAYPSDEWLVWSEVA